MQELFRLFSKSSPTILNDEAINSIGIQSHPEKYQSSRFKRWLELCKAKNRTALEAEVIKFLQSKDSINSLTELGKEWAEILFAFFKKGNGLTKEYSLEIIKEHKVEALFAKNKDDFAKKYMAVADTMLGLLILKSLGSQSNIDYQAVLKVMAYIERCIDLKCKLPEIDIRKYFEKRILIPSCFSKYNPCDEPVPTDSRFPFLEKQVKNNKEEIIKGCISGADCTCKENENCVKQSKCCVKPRIDKVELMVVKTETKCYKAGDISFIKNVLLGEKLSTKHTELIRTEELTETESDIKQFEEKYLQTDDKTSLHKETEDTLKTDKGTEAGVTTNSSFGYNATSSSGAGYKFDASGGTTGSVSLSQSKSLTNKMVQDYSKDVINRSTKQLEQKIRNISSVKRVHETNEVNKHSFDNSGEKSENVNGQYLFVNKISKAQVYNYGRSSVIDLILPEPAALYKRLFEKKFKGKKPSEPAIINIYGDENGRGGLGIDEITPSYVDTIKSYISDLPLPPKQTDTVGPIRMSVSYNKNDSKGSNNEHYGFDIPDNYQGISMRVNNITLNYHGENGISASVTVGPNGTNIFDEKTGSYNWDNPQNLPNIEGHHEAELAVFGVIDITWDLFIDCRLKPEIYKKWQTDIYLKIVEYNEKVKKQYDKDLAEYEKAKEEFEAKVEEEKKERYNKNPFILRELEKQELKRMAISYISCQFYDQFDAMKNKVEPCGYPEMNVQEAYEEGLFVQFFEQAFNWNLMTYIFYPYFWGKKCGWGKSVKEEATDLIFEKFLQAGSCHVQIPIRPSHHTLVQHFIDFGEVWQGAGEPPLPNDPYYVSIAQEIKEQFQNFNTEREGVLDTLNSGTTGNTNKVILRANQDYWDTFLNQLNTVAINADIDREILIDYVTYRIVDIQETTPASANHDTWEITLDRDYKGTILANIKWSTGAIYVGAPWEFLTPTNLVFLRNKSKCLPCYPLEECKEQ